MHDSYFGFEYVPGNGGKNRSGNGKHKDALGNLIECCCDECDFLMCCIYGSSCDNCSEFECEYNKKEL